MLAAKDALLSGDFRPIFDHWEIYFNVVNEDHQYEDTGGTSIFFKTYARHCPADGRPQPVWAGTHIDTDSETGKHLIKIGCAHCGFDPRGLDAGYFEAAYILCLSAGDFADATRHETGADAARLNEPAGSTSPTP